MEKKVTIDKKSLPENNTNNLFADICARREKYLYVAH
jgi:hypothetical protein